MPCSLNNALKISGLNCSLLWAARCSLASLAFTKKGLRKYQLTIGNKMQIPSIMIADGERLKDKSRVTIRIPQKNSMAIAD